jgi:hypothetical protein
MDQLTKVIYAEVDHLGNETGVRHEVALASDGSADLSNLPPELRETWENIGIPDEFHLERVFPSDGSAFLEGLLRLSNQSWRFYPAE